MLSSATALSSLITELLPQASLSNSLPINIASAAGNSVSTRSAVFSHGDDGHPIE